MRNRITWWLCYPWNKIKWAVIDLINNKMNARCARGDHPATELKPDQDGYGYLNLVEVCIWCEEPV